MLAPVWSCVCELLSIHTPSIRTRKPPARLCRAAWKSEHQKSPMHGLELCVGDSLGCIGSSLPISSFDCRDQYSQSQTRISFFFARLTAVLMICAPLLFGIIVVVNHLPSVSTTLNRTVSHSRPCAPCTVNTVSGESPIFLTVLVKISRWFRY